MEGGVERGGEVLLDLGLGERLGAVVGEALSAPVFDPTPDPVWRVPNLAAAASLARRQADRVQTMLRRGNLPLVLGGDDSVLLGCLLALARTGPAGLVMLDGHTDFWDPRLGDGELSDSDLYLATGRGPEQLADLEGLGPLVADEHCVVYGHRDRAEQIAKSSADVYSTRMLVRNLAEVRAAGTGDAARHALAWLRPLGPGRVWLHLDADCLDDTVMPAVDWRQPGGLSPGEVSELLKPILGSGIVAGMDVTIYNPALDDDHLSAGRLLADLLVELLADWLGDALGPARAVSS